MTAFCAAHRGLSAEQPENTLASFQAAVIAGFPALEMDLRVTADGEVVVLHDPGIEHRGTGQKDNGGKQPAAGHISLNSIETSHLCVHAPAFTSLPPRLRRQRVGRGGTHVLGSRNGKSRSRAENSN